MTRDDENAPYLRQKTLPPDPAPVPPSEDDPREVRALEILHAFTEANPPETP